jgi:hypothetical protein
VWIVATAKRGIFAIGMLAAALLSGVSPGWGEPAEPERQVPLALEYQLSLSRTPASEAALREKLYLALIDECPVTEAAEEAYWALSNLYLDDFDEPKEDKAQEILEKFLERYPASQWRSHVEDRLAWFQITKK